jgi:hypothetical protein
MTTSACPLKQNRFAEAERANPIHGLPTIQAKQAEVERAGELGV